MPSPIATSASSICWLGSRWASAVPTRAHTGTVGPAAARTARTTSRNSSALASTEPPHRSSRWLL